MPMPTPVTFWLPIGEASYNFYSVLICNVTRSVFTQCIIYSSQAPKGGVMRFWLVIALGSASVLAHTRVDARHFWWNGGHHGHGVFAYSHTQFYGYRFHRPTYAASVGAIAYSFETDRVGYSSGHANVPTAASAARWVCGAPDCQAVVWVAGGCAAISVSRSPRNHTEHALGWAYSGNREVAVQLSLRACRNQGGGDCAPRAWVCSW